jgi:hypothetical protein
LIATRLGKNPAPDSVSAPLPPFPPHVKAHGDLRPIGAVPAGEIMLVRALTPGDIDALTRTVANDAAAPFLRAAMLFVGLCADDVAIIGERERRIAGKALTDYAAMATDEISRIFLQAKVSRAPAPFRPTDAGFDEAARGVLSALGIALA